LSTKNQLRKIFLEKRLALSDDDYAALNQQLLQQFKTLDLSGLQYIHIFLPMASKKEPDTMLLIYWLKSVHPNIQLAYPKTDFADFTIASYLDDDELQLQDNAYGITEPVKGNKIDTGKADMVIVPLLVFDKQGHRVGYGKGFYDRFMDTCKPGTRFVGLSLFDPVDDISGINEHDMVMHQCVTPSSVWQF
jgi:5-formyltetrahydrofolate cyclo-ligase